MLDTKYHRAIRCPGDKCKARVARPIDETAVGHRLAALPVGVGEEVGDEEGVLVVVPVAERDNIVGARGVAQARRLARGADHDGAAEPVDICACVCVL